MGSRVHPGLGGIAKVELVTLAPLHDDIRRSRRASRQRRGAFMNAAAWG
jgi:hypothetical protein